MTLLLASDLDGTLLRSDGSVAAETASALSRGRDGGLIIAFATGRPPRWLHEVAEQTGHAGVAIGANGAVVYDLHAERVVHAEPLDVKTVQVVTRRLRQAFPGVAFGMEYGLEFGHEPEYRHDWEVTPVADRLGRLMPAPEVAPLAQLIDRPVLKVLAKWREAPDPQAFMQQAAELLQGDAMVTRSSSGPLLEISAPGITKATGLAHLADSLGIDAGDVVAVGDMPNDVPMLAWAGRSYAVANAHPSVRQAADVVLPWSNDEHAVARLIDQLLAAPARAR